MNIVKLSPEIHVCQISTSAIDVYARIPPDGKLLGEELPNLVAYIIHLDVC